MQDIAEKLKSFSSQAGDSLSKGLNVAKEKASDIGASLSGMAANASDYLQANPTLAAMLLAGGGAGLLGGYLTSRQPEEEGESKASRRMRILRNALLAGGAGVGAIGLGAEGLRRFNTAIPAGSKTPIEEKVTSLPVRGAGAVGAGLLGLSRGGKLDETINASDALRYLAKQPNGAALLARAQKMSPEAIVLDAARHGFQASPSIINKAMGDVTQSLNDPRLAQLAQKFKGTKVLSGLQAGAPQAQKALQLLLGRTNAANMARLLGVGGFFLPEVAGGIKDTFAS